MQSSISKATAERELLADFSGGIEPRPVPIFADKPAELATLPAEFCYLRTSSVEPGEAERVAAWARSTFSWGDDCGVAALGRSFVLPSSRLVETLEWGLIECGPSCTELACIHSRVVSKGILLPLEVFMTNRCGWGLRCAQAVLAGAFICEYAGTVCLDQEATHRCPDYLFDLDHFIWLERNGTAKRPPYRRVYPPLPPRLSEREQELQLTVDASQCGNVGRFLNHSCDPNLVVQPVLTQGCSALHYKIAFFAKRDIAQREELTYHYNWAPEPHSEMELWCTCGAACCQGRLL